MSGSNATLLIKKAAAVSLALFLACAWIGPEKEWNNPWDEDGINPVDAPVITRVSPDTAVIIPVNDSLSMVVDAKVERGSISGYRWFFGEDEDFISTSDGVFSRSWGITDTGMHLIKVQAVNNWDMPSDPKYFQVTVLSCRPFIIERVTDTAVSQKAEVKKNFTAGDSNGIVTMYFWKWGSDNRQWDDSMPAKTTYGVSKAFSNTDGGPLQVVWAARDDDGLFAYDTFTIFFNRGPDSVWLKDIFSEDSAKFDLFDILNNTGSIKGAFCSSDPDPYDTMTYDFLLVNDRNDTVFFYRGRDTAVSIDKLSPKTTYFWRLSVKDLFGDMRSDSGKFVTSSPPPGPRGMVLIQSAGIDFQMGQSGFDSSEAPIHTAGFSYYFWMDTTEVTRKAFASVMGTAVSDAEAELPVVNISWFDAVLYCNRRSRLEGKDTVYAYNSMTGEVGRNSVLTDVTLRPGAAGYRLPTEAEWEYACRMDSLTLFFWGNDHLAADEYAWTRENSNNTVHEVALKKPNRSGLYDMAGNVWEWCNDWFDPRYYTCAPIIDPMGPQNGTERVIRGGSWKHSLYFAQAGTRSKMAPQSSSNAVGFRTVLVVK